jgi:phosphate:Na+ symporter
MFCGLVAVGQKRRAITRDLGRALIGLALMLLALRMLVETMQPLEASDGLRQMMLILTVDPFVTVVLAAVLSWAAHSSVAIVIFIMSLSATGIVTPEAALRMVIGANLGAALNPVLAEWGGNPAQLRLPMGNLINRLIGAVVLLPLVGLIVELMNRFDEPWARLPADFHVIFNLATAVLFYLLLPVQARLLKRMLPRRADASEAGAPQYLDPQSVTDAPVAVANAAREMMRMADVVESMLVASQQAFHENDRDKIAAVSRQDDVLDRLNDAIQRYLAAISSEAMAIEETERIGEILSFAINLEHIGDIIDKNLMELAAKRIRLQVKFSSEILNEIDEMHAKLREHLKLALTVFMFADEDAARRLVAEKERFRDFEHVTRDRHLQLIGSGKTYGLEMNALQLDVTRDLKRIEAHIATNAHKVLERSGKLRASRLRT